MKATLTQTSIGPSCSSTVAAARSTCVGSATSAGTDERASPGRLDLLGGAPARPLSPRASRATAAPRGAERRSPSARPIPPLAPVTTTTCCCACCAHVDSFVVGGAVVEPICGVVVTACPGAAGLGEPLGRLEEQGVHERLRGVAAQLPLVDVVLLGEQAGRPAGGPVALEPAHRLDLRALLVRGQRHQEAAEQEGALGVGEGSLVRAEPVHVARRRPARRARRPGWRASGDRRPASRRGCRAAAARRRPGRRRAPAASGPSGAGSRGAVSASIASARALQAAPPGPPGPRGRGAQAGRAGQPGVGPALRRPAPRCRRRDRVAVPLIAATATSTARQWSRSSRSCRPPRPAAAALSPKASSWNCSLTQFPTRPCLPGSPAGRGLARPGPGRRSPCRRAGAGARPRAAAR